MTQEQKENVMRSLQLAKAALAAGGDVRLTTPDTANMCRALVDLTDEILEQTAPPEVRDPFGAVMGRW